MEEADFNIANNVEEDSPHRRSSQQVFGERLSGVPLTKNHAKQLAQKIHRANHRRNRLEYYLLFSKNIHWIIYWPSVVLSAVAGCAAFVTFEQQTQSNNIGWLSIFTGVIAMVSAALTAINGAARFPAREQICREFIAKWGHYADRYTTLLNKRYRDIQETSGIVEQAIEEFSELEIKSPDIPTIVIKLYKTSSIAKEIDEDQQDFQFDFNSEPELLSPTNEQHVFPIDKTDPSDNMVVNKQPQDDHFIPDLQKELDARSISD